MVAEVLGSIPTDDEVRTPGSGPVAFGALPFDRRAAATLVVPSMIFGRSAEGDPLVHDRRRGRRRTDIGAARRCARSRRRPRSPYGAPAHPSSGAPRWPRRRRASTPVASPRWCSPGSSRSPPTTRSTRPCCSPRLRRAYPAALCFAVDGFVGASPELLVSRVGDIVRAQPMAGTTPRTGEPEADQRRAAELLASHKNRVEHQITIDMVHDALAAVVQLPRRRTGAVGRPRRAGAAPGQHRRRAALPTCGARARAGGSAAPDARRRRLAPRRGVGPDRRARADRPRTVRRTRRLDRCRGQRRMGGRHPFGPDRPHLGRGCSPAWGWSPTRTPRRSSRRPAPRPRRCSGRSSGSDR